MVNPPVFEALDRFDDKLHGNTNTDALREAVTSVFQILQPCAFEKPENFLREAKPGISGPIGCSLMAI
ncbi:hypothetical protein D5270_03810 [Acutalibacter sp. 1XD8-36]|nr:hypothetical protein [Acutalibacter sp. 1XD8-36]